MFENPGDFMRKRLGIERHRRCRSFRARAKRSPWPLTTGNAAPSWTNATVGEVCIFQTVIWALFEVVVLPPLLTTRPTPFGPVK